MSLEPFEHAPSRFRAKLNKPVAFVNFSGGEGAKHAEARFLQKHIVRPVTPWEPDDLRSNPVPPGRRRSFCPTFSLARTKPNRLGLSHFVSADMK